MIARYEHPGRAAPARCALGAHPPPAATPTLPRPRRRPPHRARPGLHGRDHLHGPHLHPVGAAAGGRVRLRQRDHLLATLRRVGGRGGVRAAPGAAAGRTGRRGAAGLVAGERGLGPPARGKGGTCVAQTRSIGPSAGPNCTWPSRARGCRCRCWCRRPTPATAPCSRRCLTTSPPSAPRRAAAAAGPARSTATRATTTATAAPT